MKQLLPAQHTNKRAFSLVEVLVSITILLLVVVTPMTIVTRANNSTAFANEQMVAFFLAQEGLELVEKGRNDLYLQYYQKLFGGSPGIYDPMTRFVNINNQNVLSKCVRANCGVRISNLGVVSSIRCQNNNNNCRLYYDANSRRSKYVHGGATPSPSQVLTPYTRTVRMIPTINGTKLQEVKVISTVTWRTGSLIAGQTVTLETYLSNIYDTI